MHVSPGFFHLLGVPASLGRTLASGEDTPGRNRVAVISDSLWKTHFGSDPNVLQKTVRLNSEPFTVVGVMPPNFKLWTFPAQIWIPLVVDPKELVTTTQTSRSFYILGRLGADSTMLDARNEMSVIARRLEKEDSKDKGWGVTVLSLQEFQIRDMNSRTPLLILMLAVSLVLIIACSNVAGLLLARAGAREQEFAVRTALGARRLRLIRQLLVELLPIACLGSALGLLFSAAGIFVLRKAIAYNDFLAMIPLELDFRVLAFTVLISFFSLLLFGLAPALQLSRSSGLVGNDRTITSDKRRRWKRRVLLTGQVALSLVLSTGATLAIIAFLDELRTSPGFNSQHVLVARVSLPGKKYATPEQQLAFYRQALERVQSLPGVASASTARALPAAAEAPPVEVQIAGQPQLSKSGGLQARLYVASPDYFSTMEIPLIEGRVFSSSDNVAASPVALVNRAFARQFFPNGQVVGKSISVVEGLRPPVWHEVVGVVGNVMDSVGLQAARPQVYESDLQSPSETSAIVIRGRGETSQLVPLLRQAIWSIDPDLPLTDVMMMSEVMDVRGGAAGDRLLAELLSIFALVAVVLTSVGVYGVVLYGVNQRTREIGVRLALGANKLHVARLVFAEGAAAVGIGLVLGSVLAFPLPSLFSNLFEGFHAEAAPIVMLVSLLLVGVTFAACTIPVRKATRVDPVAVLRQE